MKIFIDSNIFLYLLLNRSSLFSSQKVIQNIIDGDNDGYVSDISLLNIDYVAK